VSQDSGTEDQRLLLDTLRLPCTSDAALPVGEPTIRALFEVVNRDKAGGSIGWLAVLICE
jgi:hypothetical protein